MWFSMLSLLLVSESWAYPAGIEETLGHIRSKVKKDVQIKAVQDLLRRIIPDRHEDFVITINSSKLISGNDYFKIENIGTKVHIEGGSGVAVASGFNYFLKYSCNSHISWETTQLSIPEKLPKVSAFQTFQDRVRYYQNVCTTGYSFTWWSWEQWEKHIDWIVMNSFNLVLTFNGQEAIWQTIYRDLGMTEQEIDEHFTGPAFLPWNRMGNLRGWAGPLSTSWHARSVMLQKKIVQRLRSFGVLTVLPAFAGHVPRAFDRLFPNATLYKATKWNKFNDTYTSPYLLDPTDPLFKTVGNKFLTELIKEFGTDHVYNCDTFNEMDPPSRDTTYLKAIGRSIYSAMTDVDPQALWVMQGWLFVHPSIYWDLSRAEALLTSVPLGWMFYYQSDFWTDEAAKSFLTSVPLGKMIVLDLQSEQFPQYDRLDNYFGQPYIWCMLHNFGGTLSMYGSSDIINKRIYQAREDIESTMIGSGITPEGINQNYVIYELMAENAWRSEPTMLGNWFASYASRRYGSADADVKEAWNILRTTVYNFKGLNLQRGKFVYNRSPRTKLETWTWYNHCDLLQVWRLLLKANLGSNDGYLHDLVDVTRQVLQNFADEFYDNMIKAFKEKNIEDFQKAAAIFLEVFDDVEKTLASNKNFLLGNWLRDAKNCADNEADEILFEYNARNQITLWGPRGEIRDYANKQWSGIVSNYFQPRWIIFVEAMNESLVKQKPFKEAQVLRRIFKNIEEPFTFDRTSFPDKPQGDTLRIAKDVYAKWSRRGRCGSEKEESATVIVVD